MSPNDDPRLYRGGSDVADNHGKPDMSDKSHKYREEDKLRRAGSPVVFDNPGSPGKAGKFGKSGNQSRSEEADRPDKTDKAEIAGTSGTSDVSDEPDLLVVATMRRWVADDFADAASARGLPVRHSWGLDVPDLDTSRRPAWWTPTEHAARLLRAGVALPLLATGPRWLAGVPTTLLGRPLWAGQLADLGDAPTAGWAKPAEAKVAKLEAAWWDDIADFAAAATAAGLPPQSWVQVSPTRLQLDVEHRCFVVAGQVLTTSPYLLRDGSTYEPGMEQRSDLGTEDACAFARDVVSELGSEQPYAYVLDVARTDQGRWLVVEGNPAWSAAAYGCSMEAVLETVLTAADHAHRHPRWHWQPDPWLVARAARAAVLKR